MKLLKYRIIDGLSVFLFSLYFWLCLEKRDRESLKKGRGMRIATPVYRVKETILLDISYSKRNP